MDEAYIGTIIAWAPNFAPVGWAFCEGQTLPVDGNQALYSLIGDTYGIGARGVSFMLPDLRSQSMGHVRYIICMEGLYPQRP